MFSQPFKKTLSRALVSPGVWLVLKREPIFAGLYFALVELFVVLLAD